jgi:lactoylglutathione lyase
MEMWFKYTGIRVKDLNRSLEFYTKTMGLKKIDRGTMRASGKYILLKDEESGQRLELNYYPPGTKFYEEYCEGSELDQLAFWSKNVREDYRRLLAAGATVAVKPWDEGGYTLAFVRDPDGIWIELIGKKPKLKPEKTK